MSLEDKLQSIRSVVGGEYVKPSMDKLNGFIQALKQSSEATDYLYFKRGISESTATHFRLGYCSDKHAIVIPVFKRGELINLRYRYIDPEKKPKYTQEKGCEIWIYNDEGLSKGLKKGGVLIVEGEFDLMSVYQAGFKNVISPASGKDSYGIWLEVLDAMPKIYIAYDNDKPGKEASIKMADRIGVEKCLEVSYPGEIKDANDYFHKYDREEFKNLLRNATPFYKYTFKGVSDILGDLRDNKVDTVKLDCIPYVEWEDDWFGVISGTSNVGKTTYVLNIANELTEKGIPTLVLPFERGIKTVGKRFAQVKFGMSKAGFSFVDDEEWQKMITETAKLPLYFALPKNEELYETIRKAKRIFDIKFVIVDHLNYLVRKSDKNENAETSKMLMDVKSMAQELGVVFLLVHHINKPQQTSGKSRRPKKEDLKGSSSLYQDPEVVIMLHNPDDDTKKLEVIIEKNKDTQGSKVFDFDTTTGVISENADQAVFDSI